MSRNVLIDVDSTLFDFTNPLYKGLLEINPNIPNPRQWESWAFAKPYVGTKDFYGIVDAIHREQDKYKPFPKTRELLNFLTDKGFKVYIATHRKKDFYVPLFTWLVNNRLKFDHIRCTSDKTMLFDDNVEFIFDDSPLTLNKAVKRNIKAYTLEFPYNKGIEGVQYFKDIEDFLKYLMEVYQ